MSVLANSAHAMYGHSPAVLASTLKQLVVKEISCFCTSSFMKHLASASAESFCDAATIDAASAPAVVAGSAVASTAALADGLLVKQGRAMSTELATSKAVSPRKHIAAIVAPLTAASRAVSAASGSCLMMSAICSSSTAQQRSSKESGLYAEAGEPTAADGQKEHKSILHCAYNASCAVASQTTHRFVSMNM